MCQILNKFSKDDFQTKPQTLFVGFLICKSIRPLQPIEIGGEATLLYIRYGHISATL